MKYYLFSAITVLLMTSAVHAQHVNIGVKGGLNLYTLMGDNSSNFDPKLSFHAGLLGHIHLTDRFAIQPEVMYSDQGTRTKFAGINAHVKLDYINVPVLFQYMFDNGFRFQVGPQLGILLNAKTVLDGQNYNFNSSFKSTDIGATIGMSYVKPSTGLGFDIRYNHGFTNINAIGPSNSYNRGIQLGIFYLFGHKS